ncbi:hypothetical protein [Anderseniella sp. Alg231-50]|uniref:hypothetical protein n=1 Tax=Anderseniella sp. Alg231-50 TaxID=1922226 RepID=UPI000D553AD1
MLRTPIAALTAALILTAFSGQQSQAADPHWFYDNAAAPSYDERYSEEYRRDWQNDRVYEPRHSVYQREPEYKHRRPRHRDDYGNGNGTYNGRLSCLQAVGDLKDAGFRHIEVVTCRNGDYVYDAVRGREPWRIQVSRASGEIINVEPLGD